MSKHHPLFKRRIQMMCYIFWLFPFFLQGQNLLNEQVAVDGVNRRVATEILEELERKHDFYFSYPSDALQASTSFSSVTFQGTMQELLQHLFGAEFDFKEMPGYIIVRYAPKRLSVDTELKQNGSQTKIIGTVTEKANGVPVAYASIFERTQLTSTLSETDGRFELKLKKPSQTIWVTLSKDGYRDTSFVVLPTVDVQPSRVSRLMYRPEGQVGEQLEQTFIGRIFIGVRQRLQRLNLGGMFVKSPYQMSLVPGIGSQGIFGSQMVNTVSLNLVGGYSAGTEGFEAAGVFNINRQDMNGVQVAGLTNLVGGAVYGVQVAGIRNKVYAKTTGVQVAGIQNHSADDASGIQVAGIENRTDSTATLQIAGITNRAGHLTGLQVAGISNSTTQSSRGIQVAGLVNHSAGDIGAQIGMFNHATTANKVQLGLINTADTSAYPVGLINVIKNGQKSLSFAVDELGAVQLLLRTGGSNMYGLVGFATFFNPELTPYAMDVGIGRYLLKRENHALDLEFVGRVATNFRSVANQYFTARLLPQYSIKPSISVYLAPSINFAVLDTGKHGDWQGWQIAGFEGNLNNYRLTGGISGGLMFSF